MRPTGEVVRTANVQGGPVDERHQPCHEPGAQYRANPCHCGRRAFRVNAGVTQPGAIIAFLSYFTIILNALMMVSRLFVMYSKGAASGNAASPRYSDAPIANAGWKITLPETRTPMSTSLNTVTFSYA